MQTTISQRWPLRTVCKQWLDFANFTHYYVTDNPSFARLANICLHTFTLLLFHFFLFLTENYTTFSPRCFIWWCSFIFFSLLSPHLAFFPHLQNVFPYSNVIHEKVFHCFVIAFYGFNFLPLFFSCWYIQVSFPSFLEFRFCLQCYGKPAF